MVTSYYLMKMIKNKKKYTNNDDYFNNLYNAPISKRINYGNSICRVCLKYGAVSIFGDENEGELIEILKVIANIEVNKEDAFPKHLCSICYKFIKTANMFRKLARKTNDTLKQLPTNNILEDDWDDPFDVNLMQNSSKDDSFINKIDSINRQYKEKKENSDDKMQCQTCNKIIKKSYYKTHMFRHDPAPPKYICNVCGKAYKIRSAFVNHRRRHRTDYPYKCQLCPYRGKYSSGLKSHMHTHSNEFKYMCTKCPARFRFIGNLNYHVLVKHKEPQFKCDSCGKSFHTNLKLERHHEVDHLGLKNHVCNTCGHAFGYRQSMIKHERTVHKRPILRSKYDPTNPDNNKAS